ncbi:MAG: hypothetical protein ACOX8V_06150 [Thermoleophilia bacterium]|jgi:hypothetical protein
MLGTWTCRRGIHFVLLLAGLLSVLWMAGCGTDSGEAESGEAVVSGGEGETASGDVQAEVGQAVKVGDARVTVGVLETTFRPVLPPQRVDEGNPSTPVGGEAFYQAYVRVENLGMVPLRVDPADFTCVFDKRSVGIERTRSGPDARSLLKNASLDLILTFEAPAGLVPELQYSPPWYDGAVRVRPAAGGAGAETPAT